MFLLKLDHKKKGKNFFFIIFIVNYESDISKQIIKLSFN